MFIYKFYKRVLSPFIHGLFGVVHSCRFSPTCSEYAYFAVEKYGTIKGIVLSLRRLLRCHPFAKGGLDPLK